MSWCVREKDSLFKIRWFAPFGFFSTGGSQTTVSSKAIMLLSQPYVSHCILTVSEAIVRVSTEQRWASFPREIADINQGFLQSSNISDVIRCMNTYIVITDSDLPRAKKQTMLPEGVLRPERHGGKHTIHILTKRAGHKLKKSAPTEVASIFLRNT